MTPAEVQLQVVLDGNVAPEYHADSEMRRICHIIATTKADIEKNPHGDEVLLEPDEPDDLPYYKSGRMLLLERCELEIRRRDCEILELVIEAFEINRGFHS